MFNYFNQCLSGRAERLRETESKIDDITERIRKKEIELQDLLDELESYESELPAEPEREDL